MVKCGVQNRRVFEVDQKADPQEEVNITEVDDSRSKKCLKDLNEELLCCICCELMVLAHTLPCSVHTFCFGCIRDWLCHSKDCPNCRAKAQLKSAVPVKVRAAAEPRNLAISDPEVVEVGPAMFSIPQGEIVIFIEPLFLADSFNFGTKADDD
ncbi:peroxisome biogenesis factor 10-like [Pocillopora verrucosa]|uniref:peroxisome biogenesis factor 10-like n=1 Tax=Pocillopora verrucosa TaxID=203993 RepID=UPI00333EF296